MNEEIIKINAKIEKGVQVNLEIISETINLHPDIWSENSAVQISSHIQNLKKLIRESAIVPSENQESICGGLKDALNIKL